MVYILTAVAIIAIIGIALLIDFFDKNDIRSKEEKIRYQYTRKRFFLTRAEHEYYDAIVAAVGAQYHVFAQVHLSSILDNKVAGQNWQAAHSQVNRKSVDFLLCDKAYISPLLAIELDDKSHERLDRRERDETVERILRDAGLPLLRIKNRHAPNIVELTQKIREHLPDTGTTI